MSLKVFDAVAVAVWVGMILSFVVGLGAIALQPKPTFYGAESGICDAGCGDPR